MESLKELHEKIPVVFDEEFEMFKEVSYAEKSP